MKTYRKYFALALFATACLAGATAPAQAQLSINIGPAPVCPYGYYAYAPYACAPAGYYGPEWFIDGVFIGTGPWFHGPAHFRGRIDRHFDVRYGYRGPVPLVGERHDPALHGERLAHFGGHELQEGRR